MAYFRQCPTGWRAEIEKRGVRKARSFPTLKEAQGWASIEENRIVHGASKTRVLIDNEFLASLFPRRVLSALQDVPFTHAGIVEGAVEAPDMCGVYFLIRGGEIVYVGKSRNVLQRLVKHRNNGRKFDAYNVFHCQPEELDRYERLYITALMPPENGSLGCVDSSPIPSAASTGGPSRQ